MSKNDEHDPSVEAIEFAIAALNGALCGDSKGECWHCMAVIDAEDYPFLRNEVKRLEWELAIARAKAVTADKGE